MPNWTEEQKRAIYESGKNILVSAGAGSGKTAVLTERVVQKLKSGVHIDELLILTFTNAASLEMKERIRNNIKKDDRLKEELKRIDAAYITTFDSFALSILKKYHYKKNLSNHVRIIDSSVIELLKRNILTDIFEEYYEQKDEKFLNFIRTFSSKDDLKIKENILSLYRKISERLDKIDYLKNYIKNHSNPEFKTVLKESYQNFTNQKKMELYEDLKALKLEESNDFYTKMEDIIENILQNHSSFDVRLPNVPKDSSSNLKKIKDKMKEKIDFLKDFPSIDESLDSYKKTFSYTEIICEILLKLDDRITSFKLKEEAFEFIDIELLATRLILENDDIKEELKNKFHEILIDEYQDTNDLQEFFISLIQNHNVYMVGDIKQSIYRFRNANPNIFKDKYDTFKENKLGIKIDMNQNFRSRKEVIDDINHLFENLMTEKSGIHYRLEHQMHASNPIYSTYHPENDYHLKVLTYEENNIPKEEVEATIIALDILKKIEDKMLILDKNTSNLREIKYQDFAILLDRTTYSDTYKKVFEKYQIPLNILKDESIFNNDLISIIKNIIHYIFASLKGENINFYFTSIARSFLFEYTDDEIFTILNEDKVSSSEIQNKIDNIKEKIKVITSLQLVEEIIRVFQIEEKLIQIGNIKENEKILDTILTIAKEVTILGYTPEKLNEFLEDIFLHKLDIKLTANMENENGVKFMTIHKSKGLEFPICYFAGLQKKFNISDLNDLFLYDHKFGIVTPVDEEGIMSIFLKEIIKDNYIKEEVEEKIRLFYVALTRCKEQIIFITPSFDENIKVGNLNECRSFYDFLNMHHLLLEPFIEKREIEYTKQNIESIKEEEVHENIKVVENNITKKKEEEERFSKHTYTLLDHQTKKNIAFGKKIHSIFEYADFFHIDELDDEAKYYIQRFLKHGFIQKQENPIIYKEYEFMYVENDKKYHGIIDLMIVLEDYINIIDYKLKHIEDTAYLEQLKGYQSYIEKQFKKPVKIYLYSILDDVIKEL